MGLLSKLLGNPSDDTEEVEEEVEEDEPETEEYFHLVTDVEKEIPKKTAKVRFTSGREEEITYHKYDQSGERRKYKLVESHEPWFKYTGWTYKETVHFTYEQVKEISMRNVETIDIIEEESETFEGTLEREKKVGNCSGSKRQYLDAHEDAERIEKEVNDGDSE